MGILFWIGIAILAIILIAAILYGLPSTKGWAGERVVRTILKTLPSDKYIVLNDVKFFGREKDNKGPGRYKGKRWSCQIDHLVISEYGIFCIETKNFFGKIIGNYNDKYLQRRVLGMRYNTYSPIYQNHRHLQRLVETFPEIKANKKALHSIICFMSGGKPIITGSGAATICKPSDLRKHILNYNTEVIPEDVCYSLAKEIKNLSIHHKN